VASSLSGDDSLAVRICRVSVSDDWTGSGRIKASKGPSFRLYCPSRTHLLYNVLATYRSHNTKDT
jgi:hypothetical protein